MTRKVILALVILAVVAAPVPALAGGHRSHGGQFVSVDIFAAPYAYAPYPYFYPYPYYYPYAYPYPAYSPPVVVEQPPVIYQPPAVQREVVYPNGRYVLYGDGVNQAYQWVWMPAAQPVPPPPPPK